MTKPRVKDDMILIFDAESTSLEAPIMYKPSNTKDESRNRQLKRNFMDGIFAGNGQRVDEDGLTIWWLQILKLDDVEVSQVYLKRI